MKIFIIDNEVPRQRNLRAILSSLGYKSGEVESSDDPSSGLNELKKRAFGALFVCREIPKQGAVELIKQVRSSSRLKNLPIIVYSSEVSKENVMEAVESGADSFVGYPFSVSNVESALSAATRNATARGKGK